MASGWLAESQDALHRLYWVDGFLPEAIVNTKVGLVVTGFIWMAQGLDWQAQWEFSAEIPRRLVHKRTRAFEIAEVWIDEERETAEFILTASVSSH